MTIETPTVISLRDHREQASHAAINQIEGYWTSLRKSRLMPSRSEIDPRGIASSLEHAFVLERVAKGHGRFRVAGMHLNDLMGMEVRGMPITAMIMPNARDRITDALEAVFDEPATVKMTLRAGQSLGRPALEAQLLMLPLRSDLGDVSRVLGCLVAEGQIGRAPRRFEIASEERRTLVGYADVRPAPEPRPAPAPVLEDRPGESVDTTLRKSAPYLRLVKNS